MTQIDLFLKYLEDVKRYSVHTVVAYKTDLRQFYEFCGIKEDEEDFFPNDDQAREGVGRGGNERCPEGSGK